MNESGSRYGSVDAADNSAETTWNLAAGQILDKRYEIVEVLGRGGMSVVYRGRDRLLEQEVALKVLNKNLSLDKAQLDRFRNEAQACSALEHPNIVRIFRSGQDELGRPYIAMEWLCGKTLEQIFQSKERFSREYFEEIFLPVLDALVFAHSKQIIHRDLKPANIMICQIADQPMHVKVLDFGIAKMLECQETNSLKAATVGFLGSPLYMSPEQAAGAKAEPRSDIYSLACVMYQSLTGRPPFAGETPLETMYEHLRSSIPKIVEISGSMSIPVELVEVIIQALAKDPAKRPASMKDLQEKILAALLSKNTIRGSGKLTQRRQFLAAAACLVAIGFVAVVMIKQRMPPPESIRLSVDKRSRHDNGHAGNKEALAALSGLSPQALCSKADELAAMGRYKEAIPALQQALRNLSQSNDTLFLRRVRQTLADLYERTGMLEAALREQQEIIKLFKDDAAPSRLNAATYSVRILRKQGKNEAAEKICKEFSAAAERSLNGSNSPRLGELLFEYADLLRLLKRPDRDVLSVSLRSLQQFDGTDYRRADMFPVYATWLASDTYAKLGKPKFAAKEVEKTRLDLTSSESVATKTIEMFAQRAEERHQLDLAESMYLFAIKKTEGTAYNDAKKIRAGCREKLDRIAKMRRSQTE